MVRVRRAVVDLRAPDVREDPFGILFIPGNQFLHQRDRIGESVLVGVIKGESLSINLRAEKAPVRVGLQECRVVSLRRKEPVFQSGLLLLFQCTLSDLIIVIAHIFPVRGCPGFKINNADTFSATLICIGRWLGKFAYF